VFSKKFSYESKLSTMFFSCPPEQLSVLFKVSEKKDKVSFDKKACSVENGHGVMLYRRIFKGDIDRVYIP
jgi:hypothetical protein